MKLALFFILLATVGCSSKQKDKTMNAANIDFNKLWNYSNPEETREKFYEVLNNSEGKAGLDYVLQLKTQIARTYSLQANFDEAHRSLDDVESKLSDETTMANIRYLLERGRTFNSANQKDKDKELFVKAYNSGIKAKADTYTIDAAHMVAIASASLEDKIEWNTKGLEAARSTSDESAKKWVGVFHNNMGWDLFEAERYQEALVNFKECWAYHEEKKNSDQLGIAKWSYAKTLRKLGKIDKSFDIQTKLLEEQDGIDKSGYGYEELGELHLLKGDKKTASDFFGKAYAVLSKDVWLQKNEADRLNRIKNLSSEGL